MALAAENPFAARVAAPLQTHSRRFWFRYKAETGLAEAAEQHVALIRSILKAMRKPREAKPGGYELCACMPKNRGSGDSASAAFTKRRPLISNPSPAESTQLLPSVPVARIVQLPFSETKDLDHGAAVDLA